MVEISMGRDLDRPRRSDDLDPHPTADLVEHQDRSLLTTRERDDHLHRRRRPAGRVGRSLPDAHLPRADRALVEWGAEAGRIRLVVERELPGDWRLEIR